jgi:hypothetical protein
MKPLMLNVAGIPAELKSRQQWLGCTVAWDSQHQRFRKEPVGKWGDRQHWRTFDDVIAAKLWPGFIYGDGVCGFDADKCIVEGVIADDVRGQIARLDSYTELSMSGTGLHVIAFGKPIPPSVRSRELWSDGHWVAITGHHVAGTPASLEIRWRQLEQLAKDLTVLGTGATECETYDPPRVIPHGTRHHELFRYVRHLKAAHTKGAARTFVHIFNQTRCKPPVVENSSFEAWYDRAWSHHDRPGFSSPTFVEADAEIFTAVDDGDTDSYEVMP